MDSAGLASRAAGLAEAIEGELRALAPTLLDRFPVARYLAFFTLAPAMSPYHYAPPQARAYAEAIELGGGRAGLERYHRLALASLIRDGVSDGGLRLSAEVRVVREAYLARVLAGIAKPRANFHLPGNDMFAKDFAVCRGRLIPCGVELLDPQAGVPRGLVIQGGVRQVLAWMRLVARLGGVRPLWGLHFDRRLIRDFTDEGYRQLYRRVAELLALNPDIRGVTSWSWWHDPRVAGISPELAFIGRHPESAGAMLLRVGEDADATANALHFAPVRTRLYREGAYRPCLYMLAWPRADVLAWAARAPSAGPRQANSPAAK
jgi:hypothetical protein